MPFNMQGWEWVILVLVALLLFGGTRLAGVGKNAGRAIREFKDETRAIKADEAKAKGAASRDAATTPTTPDATTTGTTPGGSTAAGDVVDAEVVEPRTDPKPDTRA